MKPRRKPRWARELAKTQLLVVRTYAGKERRIRVPRAGARRG